MKGNDKYWITSILDPRVKTAWLWKNSNEANTIITHIKKYLRDSYPTEKKQTQEAIFQEKSFESGLLRQYISTETRITNDIVILIGISILCRDCLKKQAEERAEQWWRLG